MFKFRGITLDGYWITGYLTYSKKEKLYYITEDNDNEFSFPVIPESLAVTYTGLTDKNGNSIFASFEVDGKLSRGGDIINGIGIIEDNEGYETEIPLDNLKIQFDGQRFAITDNIKFPLQWYVNFLYQMANIEIIGKQWCENENNERII